MPKSRMWKTIAFALFVGLVIVVSIWWFLPSNAPFTTRWEGGIDQDFLRQVRQDIDLAWKGYKYLKVDLISPGGGVLETLETARIIHQAVHKGLVVEIHGTAIVASGGTFILAAGTPGRRYITKGTLVLIHPPQVGGGFFAPPTCGAWTENPRTELEKILNVALVLMQNAYSEYTGRDVIETRRWLTCGQEQVGDGTLAITLGLADALEG